jgi:hypothetical protein
MDTESHNTVEFTDRNGRDARGKFTSGPDNKGRPPGSKNQTRRAIRDFVTTQSGNLETWFKELTTAKDKLEYYIRLLPYCVSRLQGTSIVDDDGDVVVTDMPHIDLSQLSDDTLRAISSLQENGGDITTLPERAMLEVLAATTLQENSHAR